MIDHKMITVNPVITFPSHSKLIKANLFSNYC